LPQRKTVDNAWPGKDKNSLNEVEWRTTEDEKTNACGKPNRKMRGEKGQMLENASGFLVNEVADTC
jgi:hypothetical protein